jgi:hypothetical protein
MAQIIPLYIPTYIGSIDYKPVRVLPHIYFFNGMVECQNYYIQGFQFGVTNAVYPEVQDFFPYFDNYNVVTGSFPTDNSKSLLFNNEGAAYGTQPTGSLYSEYWEKYVSLLYNPKTRVLNCSAIIPLADYFKMELNDIINFRGNYYHLRAINDYSLKDGTCNLQLLGPIIADSFNQEIAPLPPPPEAAYSTASIKLAEYNASPTAFLDANLFVSGTAYYFSGDFTQSISGGAVADVTLEAKNTGGSINWGSFTTASATLTIKDNGSIITSSTQYYYSGSSDLNITFPTTFTAGHTITISGSTLPVTGNCCTPTINSITASGANLDVYFTNPSGACISCSYTTIESSPNNSTWGGSNTGGCSSPRTITAPTSSMYYRMKTGCTDGGVSSYSNSVLFTSSSAGTATLAWSYSETGGANGTMDLYVNGFAVESRSSTSSGTRSVNVGDTIYVELQIVTPCGSPDTYANVYTTGNILNDANCANNAGVSLTTGTYTVVSGDIGSTLTLNTFAQCDSGCL